MRNLCALVERLLACLLVCAVALPSAATAQSVSYDVPSPARAELETLTASAMRLYRRGDTAAAVRAFEAASATAEKHFGARDLKFVHALNDLALIYDVNGTLDRAEQTYRRAIEIVEKHPGAPSGQLANLRNNLAAVVLQQCRVGAAQTLYKQALQLSEKSLGADHVDTSMMRKNVARLDRYLGATTSTSIIVNTTDAGVSDIGQMLQRCVS